MANDPAFLFYPGDYLRDTQCLSEKPQVAYDRIMCEHMRNIVITQDRLEFFTKRLSADEKEELAHVLTKTDGGFMITWVADSVSKRKAFVDSRRQSRLKGDEDNVRIYIVRDNVRSTYKIGSSVNPLRRYNELSNQATPAIMADVQGSRDLSLLWFSEPVKRAEEKRLHNKFKIKNIYGEWFSLSPSDVDAIMSLYPGKKYTERTTPRTEIENEIVITGDVVVKGGAGETPAAPIPPPTEQSIVGEMAAIWKKANPDYPLDNATDGHALFEIGQFVSKLLQGKWPPETDVGRLALLETWDRLARWIAADDFYKSWALAQIARTKNLQTIWQKSREVKNDTGTGKAGTGNRKDAGAHAVAEKLKQKLAARGAANAGG